MTETVNYLYCFLYQLVIILYAQDISLDTVHFPGTELFAMSLNRTKQDQLK